MLPLDKVLRNKLERTVKEARDVAEAAGRAGLEQLGVGEPGPYGHLSEQERALRRRLRIHGRQLGDFRNSRTKQQETERLVEEVAYEHWHRMLFARFLAENSLLMYPDPDAPVPVTLEECEDLAPEEGAGNGWDLAARFAALMLPQIFRPDSPVFELTLPPEHQQRLERLLAELPVEVFTASDSLGWVYQFWQAKKKDEVNASEVKIGPRELPAVTQLFTEPYMVAFLLDNSLGAWWAARRLTQEDLSSAETEDRLRRKASLPGVPLEYLRFVSTDLTPQSPLHKWRGDEVNTDDLVFMHEQPSSKSPVTARNRIDPAKLELAKKFRKEPTEMEAEVWKWLRNRGIDGLKFRRQQIIEGFISDFYCAQHRLALEIDGPVHGTEEAKAYDEVRDAIFASKGIRTLRIKSEECSRENLEAAIRASTFSPSPEAAIRASTFSPSPEAVVRDATSSPSPFMERGPGGEVWAPAAGTLEAWPNDLSQLKVLDPCCGSGHFLVAAFLMLVPMRMELEGLSAQDAVDAVLRDNIHGLEIDNRCVQIAAFALALTAWRYPGAGGYRPLPELNLACSGLSVGLPKEEWKSLAPDEPRLRVALHWMYDEFKDAPLLGSLLNPARSDAARLVDWERLSSALEQVLGQKQSDEEHEMGVVAHGIAKAARLMAGKYHLVLTNVPYLMRGKQSDPMKKFLDVHYKESKNDLATVFLDRCLEFCLEGGTTCIVIPQNWLFLTSYRKFRERLLKNETWHLIGRLGFAAFDIMDWWAFNTTLLCISRGRFERLERMIAQADTRPRHLLAGLDASAPRDCATKAQLLRTSDVKRLEQGKQLENPDARLEVVAKPTFGANRV
jgi:very-short-patch-repair endonuclease